MLPGRITTAGAATTGGGGAATTGAGAVTTGAGATTTGAGGAGRRRMMYSRITTSSSGPTSHAGGGSTTGAVTTGCADALDSRPNAQAAKSPVRIGVRILKSPESPRTAKRGPIG